MQPTDGGEVGVGVGGCTGQSWQAGITLWNAGQPKVVGRYTEGAGWGQRTKTLLLIPNMDFAVSASEGLHGANL